MTTIELGEIDSTPDPAPATEFSRRLARQAAIAVSLLLCVLGTTGSARGSPPGIRPLWSVPLAESDGSTLGTDTAYLQRSTAGRSRLTAYDLATGAIRWETTMDGTLGYTQLAEEAGLLLLPIDPSAARTDEIRYTHNGKATTALDMRTGAALWTAPGEPMLIDGRTALMADYTGEGLYARLRLIALDRGGARPVWSRDTGKVDSLAFQMNTLKPEKIILVRGDGLVEVVRFLDGELIAQARIPWRSPDPDEGEFNDLAAAGDYLVVNRARQDHAELTVYHLGTLAEAWRTTGTNRGYAFPCGTAICFNDGDSVAAYDAPTGRQLWRHDGVGSSWAAGSDRVVAERPGAGGQVLLDAATGRAIGDPGTGETVWTTEPGEALLVLRATKEPPGQTSITRWDLATGRRQLLGAIGNLVVNRCQSVAHYLGCYQVHEFTITVVGW
jgi:outer membrane protein assembly factor BamB